MCGIAGVFGQPGLEVSPRTLKRMTDALAHRGPDGEGFWFSQSRGVGLGHRRLAIIDLSPAGRQPMLSSDGRYVITFNGEIYNYIELRNELIALGDEFRTGTDTEVLLTLFSRFGQASLSRLEGMFAFAIWDNKEKNLFCARDRIGEKPFYFARTPEGTFYFASEMKALFKAGIRRAIRKDRLYDYLAFGTVEDPEDQSSTFFEGIFQLPPAHCMSFGQGQTPIFERYWDLRDLSNTAPPLDMQQAVERYRELFEGALRRRLRADVPIGTCLSGGLDSSSITATLSRFRKSEFFSQKSFSARMHDPELDEGRFMQEVVAQTGVEPHFVWMDARRAADQFDKVLFFNEEPIISTAVISHWEVMRLASENGVVVLIDGQGPDEMLAGYTGYYDIYFKELFASNPIALARELSAYQEMVGRSFDYSLGFRLRARFPKLFSTLSPVRNRMFNAYPEDLNPEYAVEFSRRRSPFRNFHSLNEALIHSTTRRGLTFLLRMCDRNSMAFSREVRLPFLSHDLVEFSFSLPPEMKIFNGWTKFILRKAMEPTLPPAITWRRDKKGFATPQESWMADPVFNNRIQEAGSHLRRLGLISKPKLENGFRYLCASQILREKDS